MTDYDVTEAMIVFGGGFVSALGRLYRHADRDNQVKLKAAFLEYFTEYAELATLRAERGPAGTGQ